MDINCFFLEEGILSESCFVNNMLSWYASVFLCFHTISNGYTCSSLLPIIAEVRLSEITQWKKQLSAQATDVFDGGTSSEPPVDLKTLHAKIGQLTLENDFLESALSKAELLSAKR